MISNSNKKHIRKLHSKKWRQRYGEFLLEGAKGIKEAITSGIEVVMLVIQVDKKSKFSDLLTLAKNNNIQIEECSKKQANSIKTTSTFPGILAVLKKKEQELKDLKNNGPIVCLDHISNPGNLGTIIRTADWFGIKNILLSEGSVEAHNEKVVRSSMGSFFNVKIFESNDLVSDLDKLEDYKIFGLDITGEPLRDGKVQSQNYIIVFGSESHGISSAVEKKLDKRYTIEGAGEAESLNIAISAGITMYSFCNRKI